MPVTENSGRFDQAISGLCDRLKDVLSAVSQSAKNSAFEVRLHVGKPVSIVSSGRCWFVDSNSRLHNVPQSGFVVQKQDIEQSIIRMCSFSVHSHQEEMKSGYISLLGGHRAGICGTAVLARGKVSSIRDITSINLRIARDIKGAADMLMDSVLKKRLCGLLLVGAPSSGKTTVLRDTARQLASGKVNGYIKVAVIDERGELGAVCGGIPQNDLGPCCDILSAYPKGEGIMTAVRTLSPQVIICDEIGGEDEVSSMLDGVNCGVKMIASAHAASIGELLSRRQICRLLEYGVFEKIVRLGNSDTPGEIVEIAEARDIIAKDYRFGYGNGMLHDYRNSDVEKAF